MYCKKINLYCPIRCANFTFFLNCAKMQKIPKNRKILKNEGHFRNPHHKISFKKFSNICENVVYFYLLCRGVEKWQGWEFAHLISGRITRFWSKNEQMSDSLKKISDSLIRSFLVSNLSDSLTIAHFLWATWANRSWSLIFGERNERFAHIAHLIWAKWAIHSHRSPKKRKWAKMSDSLIFQ